MMKWLVYILFVIAHGSLLAQHAAMYFTFPDIRIGEQTTFVLSLEYPNTRGEKLIAWPQFDDQLTDYIEIIDRTVDFDAVSDSSSNLYIRKQEFTITCFEPGIHKLNPIGIELNDSMVYTNPTDLLVQMVEVDTSKGITDIKENYAVDYSMGEKMEDWFKRFWPFLASTGALVAIFFLIRLVRNRRPEKMVPVVPKVSAHITALKSLIELKKREAWRTESKKTFYSQLTYTVRLYLEERFGIQAIEHTTQEIIIDLKYADISDEDKAYLRKILSQADMVKFAKMKPNEQHGEDSLNKSIEFVEKTKSQNQDEGSEEEINAE